MGPMIDAELEAVDRRHAQLTRLSTELVDALNLYHQLMHENMSAAAYGMAQQPPSMVSGMGEKFYQNKSSTIHSGPENLKKFQAKQN